MFSVKVMKKSCGAEVNRPPAGKAWISLSRKFSAIYLKLYCRHPCHKYKNRAADAGALCTCIPPGLTQLCILFGKSWSNGMCSSAELVYTRSNSWVHSDDRTSHWEKDVSNLELLLLAKRLSMLVLYHSQISPLLQKAWPIYPNHSRCPKEQLFFFFYRSCHNELWKTLYDELFRQATTKWPSLSFGCRAEKRRRREFISVQFSGQAYITSEVSN